jgi:hypothetical protein
MATVYRTLYIRKGNPFQSHMATVYGTLYISKGSLIESPGPQYIEHYI